MGDSPLALSSTYCIVLAAESVVSVCQLVVRVSQYFNHQPWVFNRYIRTVLTRLAVTGHLSSWVLGGMNEKLRHSQK